MKLKTCYRRNNNDGVGTPARIDRCDMGAQARFARRKSEESARARRPRIGRLGRRDLRSRALTEGGVYGATEAKDLLTTSRTSQRQASACTGETCAQGQNVKDDRYW